MCTWTLSGNLLNRVYHRAPMWSIDISKDCKRIFTGGADGSVCTWQTRRRIYPNVITLPHKVALSTPKFISCLRNGTLLILNESGMLFVYDKKNMLFSKCFLTISLETRSHYIMQVSPCRSFVAFASRDGYVTIYQGTNICHDINININEMRIIFFYKSNISFTQILF